VTGTPFTSKAIATKYFVSPTKAFRGDGKI